MEVFFVEGELKRLQILVSLLVQRRRLLTLHFHTQDWIVDRKILKQNKAQKCKSVSAIEITEMRKCFKH